MGSSRPAALLLPLLLVVIDLSDSAGIGFRHLPHWNTRCPLASHTEVLPISLAAPGGPSSPQSLGVCESGTVPTVCASTCCQVAQVFNGASSISWCRNPKSLPHSSSVGDTRCQHLLRGSCCLVVTCLRRAITFPSPPQTSPTRDFALKGPNLRIQRHGKVFPDWTHKGTEGPSSPLICCLRPGLFG
ncbi:IL17RE isoform 3 [Pongo abelii]|uniref:IL17RE isoform 3 n=1 Tax=Pongo abelii TaxID=9601 RepID=A0A2J8WDM6_PONAB|nr:IL17RE isoform 3 [Pongo abelii]